MVKDLVHQKNFRTFHMKKLSDFMTPKEGIWRGHRKTENTFEVENVGNLSIRKEGVLT